MNQSPLQVSLLARSIRLFSKAGVYLVLCCLFISFDTVYGQSSRSKVSFEKTVRDFADLYRAAVGTNRPFPPNALGQSPPAGGPPDGFYARGASLATYQGYHDTITKTMLKVLTDPSGGGIASYIYGKDNGEYLPEDMTPQSNASRRMPLSSAQIDGLTPSQRAEQSQDIIDEAELARAALSGVIQTQRRTNYQNMIEADTTAEAYELAKGGLATLPWHDGGVLSWSFFVPEQPMWYVPFAWNPPFKVQIWECRVMVNPSIYEFVEGGVEIQAKGNYGNSGYSNTTWSTVKSGWHTVEGQPVADYLAWDEDDWEHGFWGFPRGAAAAAHLRAIYKLKKDDCGDCTECENGSGGAGPGGAGAGVVNAGVSSVNVSFGLGSGDFGDNIGQLRIKSEKPNRGLYQPGALMLPTNGSDFQFVRDAEMNLRQIITPELIVDVLVVNEQKYLLRYYDLGQAQVPQGDGTYVVAGEPLIEITIENPDQAGATYNQLKVTRLLEGKLESWVYSYEVSTDTWELFNVEADKITKVKKTYIPLLSQRLEERSVETSAGILISKVDTTFQQFTWGWEVVSVVVDPDGEALTSTSAYYTDQAADPVNYAKLKQQLDSSGHWQRFEYDLYGRLFKTVAQYLDASVGAAEAESRVVEMVYADTGQGIDYDTTIESILGQEVSRSYRRDTLVKLQEIVCVTPGAAIDAADNLVTETTYYTDSDFAGWVKSMKHPDGTMTLYSYSADQIDPITGLDAATEFTTTMETGESDGEEAAIVNGTRTITNTNRQGVVMVKVVEDIASGITIAQELVTAQDAEGRPLTIIFLDGRSETYTYACCGLESKTDRQGITTSYSVDGTVTTQIRLGIAFKNTRNGLEFITERFGTDNSVMEQSRTLSNVAGRVVQSTSPGNRITTYTSIFNGSGHRVDTATLPDGGTRISTYYSDGQLLSVSGTAVQPVSYEYGVADADGGRGMQRFTKTILLDGNGAPTGEWTQSFVDLSGRGSVVYNSGGGEISSEYNNLGQLVKATDTDGVISLFEYDGRGQQTVTAQDINGNGQIDYGGSDRISRNHRFVTTRAGAGAVSRTETERWTQNGADAPTLVSQSDASVTGDESWTTSGAQVSHQQIIYGAPSDWVITSTQPDGSKLIQTYTGGRLVSSVFQDSGGGPLGGTTYTYDTHGRVITTTDARNGTSTVTYYDTDEVQNTTTPAPGGGGGAQTTSIVYDAAGRQDIVTLPDGGQVDYDYYLTGSLKKVSGARTYTVEYAYDAQGRLITQTTNPGAAEQQVTAWVYEAGTGRLSNKTLPGGSSVSYTYTVGGRTATRTNARGITTTYTYAGAGDLSAVNYSDTTAGVTFAQGRNGQAASVTHDGSTYSYAYNDFGQVIQESVNDGILGGVSLSHNYDALRRRSGLVATTGASSVNQGFVYDPLVSRLKTVSQGDRSATYNYVVNSALINSIEHKTAGAVKMTENRVYDQLNRLTSMSAASSAATNALNRATAYTYNNANQRTMADLQDGSYWTYTYDGYGHVTSADHHRVNGDLMAGRQSDYAYDALGNRQSASFGGDVAGGAMQSISYTPKAGDRNQYGTIANPGVVVTTGEANAGASITVDTVAAIRQGDWFAQQSSVDNSAGAVYASLDIEAIEGANTDSITRKQLVPAASVTPTYDADGNLTFDGYQDFTWDAENRLTSIEVRDTLVPTGAPKYRIEFSYDYSGRRISTRTFGGGVGNWTLANETKYIYDGWNVIAEFSGTGLISKSYLWGLDLSGSMQGAGGVGGLLSIEQHLGDGASRHYVAYDGNGNVIGLADADTGEMSALYEYDAFGQVLQMEGAYAVKNSYRFSTKPQEGMTGLYYYGYRFLDAGSGRWLSRDPIGEKGGFNLYGFVFNNTNEWYDDLGAVPRKRTSPRGFLTKKNVKRNQPYTSKKQSDQAKAFDRAIENTVNNLEKKYGKYDPKTRTYSGGTEAQARDAIDKALEHLFDPTLDKDISGYLGGIPLGGGFRNLWYNRNLLSCEKQRAKLILEGVHKRGDSGCCVFNEVYGEFLGEIVFKAYTPAVYIPCLTCGDLIKERGEGGTMSPDDGNDRNPIYIDYYY